MLIKTQYVSPQSAKANNVNYHPPKYVVSRYRDPQFQMGENCPYLFILRPKICRSWSLNTHFIPNFNEYIGKYNTLKTSIVAHSGVGLGVLSSYPNSKMQEKLGLATQYPPTPPPPYPFLNWKHVQHQIRTQKTRKTLNFPKKEKSSSRIFWFF